MPPPSAAPTLEALAIKLAAEGPHKILPTPRLVQILHNGVYIVRTTGAAFVWEVPYYPQLYFPAAALKAEGLQVSAGDEIKSKHGKVIAHRLTLKVGDKSTDDCIRWVDDLSGLGKALAGLVKITFNAVDQWFEEATPIYIHPKDPFKRIDILQSTRPMKISIHGVTVAETSSSMHLYETGLPCRYYFPLTNVKAGVLVKSDLKTGCPYKGEAEYYSVDLGEGRVAKDVVWYYTRPTLECAKIEGLVCFYNEKVDIKLDGKKLEKPVSPFS
ncbi:hypothetical protein B0A48_02566 [Cryoendolithus antarcticus]|uniref:DUF427 domain-containing protein n=1 Tax=Cryoendolithus antarcticus TaxID=1507870 RepID=A0A1V8TPG9_9PEZI|nr:hypothetical protein B0A48_02566 [Cryoendolithus antarcticus]